jgi:hypothetical protein
LKAKKINPLIKERILRILRRCPGGERQPATPVPNLLASTSPSGGKETNSFGGKKAADLDDLPGIGVDCLDIDNSSYTGKDYDDSRKDGENSGRMLDDASSNFDSVEGAAKQRGFPIHSDAP